LPIYYYFTAKSVNARTLDIGQHLAQLETEV